MKHRGFSLIGVVVALSVLSVGILSTAQLMARTENTVGVSRERLVAINLAREGVELVQARRDANWGELINPNPNPDENVDSWVEFLCPEDLVARAGPYMFTIESQQVSPPPDEEYILTIIPDGDTRLRVMPGTGVFTHQAGVGEDSIYSREVRVDCVQANDEQTDGQEYIDVSVVVRWNTREANHDVTLNTRLVDWSRR